MFYTLGHKESYEQYFREQSAPFKMGRKDEYPGGSVWLTKEEAEKHCPSDYAVYGVLADWDNDTILTEDGDWHDLLIDAPLCKI